MNPEGPTPDEPTAVSLSEAEQDELNNRVLSGDADQESSAENAELARLGSYVLLEVDDDQRVEKHADEQTAAQRYEDLKRQHIDQPGG